MVKNLRKLLRMLEKDPDRFVHSIKKRDCLLNELRRVLEISGHGNEFLAMATSALKGYYGVIRLSDANSIREMKAQGELSRIRQYCYSRHILGESPEYVVLAERKKNERKSKNVQGIIP